jgi:hypothetical protein
MVKPGGRDSAGNYRPRMSSPRRRAQCGHWWARPSGGSNWCERCGEYCGPTGPGGQGSCDCFRQLVKGKPRLARRLAWRFVKIQCGLLPRPVTGQ